MLGVTYPQKLLFTVEEAARQGHKLLLQVVDVWDFCVLDDVVRASAVLTSSPEGNTAHEVAIRAAASCSSAARLTPLHVAAGDGDAELAARLLHVGAQLDIRNKSGATPLFLACEAGHASVVQLLLAVGADLWLETAFGENPLYISALRGHEQVGRVCFMW
jgi:ankyrin repeat protein